MLLFTIFIIVITQKLVLQQSKNVTAKCTETLLPPPCIQFSMYSSSVVYIVNRSMTKICIVLGTVSINLSDLPFIKRHVWFTTVPFKLLSGQRRGTSVLMYTCTRHLIFRVSTKSLIKQKFKEYRCKMDMPLYKWKLTWNYTYSPFKIHIYHI